MQLHERDLALIEADLVFTRSYCHSAVIVPGEHADIDLAAVHRLVEPDLDLAAHELFKVPRALQLTLCPGRADLENLAVRNGIGLVQNRVEPAADALAVVNTDAAVLIDKDAQEPASGLTDIFNVPKAAAFLLDHGLCKLRDLVCDLTHIPLTFNLPGRSIAGAKVS